MTASPNGTFACDTGECGKGKTWKTYLLGHSLDDPRQEMIFVLARPCPRCEIPELAIVAVVGKPHLRSYEKNLSVVCNDATVVDHVLMHHRPVELCSQMPPL
jgi:hypothetical protein